MLFFTTEQDKLIRYSDINRHTDTLYWCYFLYNERDIQNITSLKV